DLATPALALSWAEDALRKAAGETAKKNALRMLARLRGGILDIEFRVLEEGKGANLAGQDLRGKDLSWQYLRHADLSGADLTEARLVDADLQGASFVGATLVRADLTRARLAGADLTAANFESARLLGADLRGARLA